MTMQYTRLGASGLEVSRLCLGGNSWGAAGRRQWGGFGPEESRPFIKRALDLGINFFDTAPAYNDGASEEVLGNELVSQTKRHDIVLMTKVGYPAANRNRSGLGRKNVIASVDDSLRRLRTDYIDLLVVHRFDPLLPVEDAVGTLAELIQSGKVRYLGASSMPARHFIRLHLAARNTTARGFTIMQNLYNLLYREDERELVPFCLEENITLTPYSPLARGLLSGSREPDGSGVSERAIADKTSTSRYFAPHNDAILSALKTIAGQYGVSSAQVALAWLLGTPPVASPIVGVTSIAQLDDAASSLDLELTQEDRASLDAPYRSRGLLGMGG